MRTTTTRDPETLELIRKEVKKGLLAIPMFRRLSKEQQLAVAHDSVAAFHYIVAGDGASKKK